MREYKRESVDVILCCYNQEQYIAQAVESVIRQKVNADVRVLVADDCSTDRTLEIVKSYGEKTPFPFIYLPTTKNLGLSANYRRAFKACTSTYTAILEGDDWWSKDNHLAQHIQFLNKHKRFSMSFNQIRIFLQTNGKTHVKNWPFGNIDHVTIGLKDQISLGNQIGNLSSCVFRTELLHALPEDFYQLKFADWDLGIMMAISGPIALLKGSTSTYRINDKGLWSGLSRQKKLTTETETLDRIQPLLPDYCNKYIKEYKESMKKGGINTFPTPWQYKLRQMIKHRQWGKK